MTWYRNGNKSPQGKVTILSVITVLVICILYITMNRWVFSLCITRVCIHERGSRSEDRTASPSTELNRACSTTANIIIWCRYGHTVVCGWRWCSVLSWWSCSSTVQALLNVLPIKVGVCNCCHHLTPGTQPKRTHWTSALTNETWMFSGTWLLPRNPTSTFVWPFIAGWNRSATRRNPTCRIWRPLSHIGPTISIDYWWLARFHAQIELTGQPIKLRWEINNISENFRRSQSLNPGPPRIRSTTC